MVLLIGLIRKKINEISAGLQSLKAAAQNAQKKKETQVVCQTDSAGYTGTLKTVIKIHRQEKKGNSKAPLRMIYKASSSSSSVVTEESNNFEPEVEIAAKEVSLNNRIIRRPS